MDDKDKDSQNHRKKLFTDEELEHVYAEEKKSVWNEKEYIRKRREEPQYWDHQKMVATGVVCKVFPNLATQFKDNLQKQLHTPLSAFKEAYDESFPSTLPNPNQDANDDNDKKRKAVDLVTDEPNTDKKKPYYKNKDKKNPFNRETFLPPDLSPYGKSMGKNAYVPFDNPNAVYVNHFHPKGQNICSPDAKTNEPFPRASSKKDDTKSQTTNASHGGQLNTSREILTQLSVDSQEGKDNSSFESPDTHQQKNSTDEKSGTTTLQSTHASTTERNHPELRSTQSSFPYSVVAKFNCAMMNGKRKKEINKHIKTTDGTKTIRTVYEFQPYTKEELERVLNISIENDTSAKQRNGKQKPVKWEEVEFRCHECNCEDTDD